MQGSLPETRWKSRKGFTLPELLIVIIVIGVLVTVAGNRFRGMGNELENATRETASFLRLVRAEATTTTSAYRIIVESERALRTESARACTGVPDDAWTPDSSKRLVLREGVILVGPNAAAGTVLTCFNPRGVGNSNPTLTLEDLRGDQRQVEALIGGGVLVTDGAGAPPAQEPD